MHFSPAALARNATGSPGSLARAFMAWLRALLLAAPLLAGLLFVQAEPACAQGLVLRNFVLDNQQGDMAVRFSIGLNDTAELQQVRSLLQQGSVLALECEARMYRKRGYWLDEPLAAGRLENILRAEPEGQLFILEQPGDRIVRASSLEELLTEAWRSLDINLGPFSLLQRGEDYSVGLEVRLKLRDVPAWKRWTLFYSDFEVVPGAHYQMNFEY